MIRNLRDLGKTILLTTHYMDSPAPGTSDIAGGVVVAEGPRRANRDDPQHDPLSRPVRLACRLSLAPRPTTGPPRNPHPRQQDFYALLGWQTRQTELDELTLMRPSLEDVYLKLLEATENESQVRREGWPHSLRQVRYENRAGATRLQPFSPLSFR
jgi:ABC-2 type transport system ATP-binding protein